MSKRIALASLAAIVAAIVVFRAGPPAPPVAAQPARLVELNRRAETTVREPGVIETASRSVLVCEVEAGTTILELVDEGTTVEAGDVVATLDPSALEEQRVQQRTTVSRAEADLTSATLALDAVERDESIAATTLASKAATLARRDFDDDEIGWAADVRAAERRVEVAKAKLAVAEHVLTSATSARQNDSASERQLLEAKLGSVVATAELGDADRELATLRGGKERRIAELDLAVAEANAKRTATEARVKTALAEARPRVTAAESAQVLARGELAKIERQIAACTMRAPRAGLVLYSNQPSRRAEPDVIAIGAAVRNRQPVVEIVDPERLVVRVRVHESRIGRVRVGQRVIIRVDALPDETWNGTVQSIDAVPAPSDWLRPNVRHYPVTVVLEKPSSLLRIGLSAVAEIDVR